jgi:hypothetical protein
MKLFRKYAWMPYKFIDIYKDFSCEKKTQKDGTLNMMSDTQLTIICMN